MFKTKIHKESKRHNEKSIEKWVREKKVSSLKKNNTKDQKRKYKELKTDMIEILSQEDTI